MLVVFAANRVLTAPNGGSVAITTEPVALDGFNVMTAVTTAHEVFGATAPFPGLRWRTEVSMDGQTWVNGFRREVWRAEARSARRGPPAVGQRRGGPHARRRAVGAWTF